MGNGSGQIELTEPELKLLQSLIYQECGMFFDERRAHFLHDRLQRRLRACGMDTFYNYYRLLTSRDGKAEFTALLENLTVNETSFFRNRPQLELFQKVILERALQHKQARRDWTLRLWSAGCSTGQEPYTLAMIICDALAYYYLRNPLPFEMPATKPLIPPPWKVEILASDISYSVLHTAQEAVYSEHQMEGVDYSYRLRYFDKCGDRYSIKSAVNSLCIFGSGANSRARRRLRAASTGRNNRKLAIYRATWACRSQGTFRSFRSASARACRTQRNPSV